MAVRRNGRLGLPSAFFLYSEIHNQGRSFMKQQCHIAFAQPSSVDVKLYTGIKCLFCPLVKTRLEALQTKMGFRLREIDVTLSGTRG